MWWSLNKLKYKGNCPLLLAIQDGKSSMHPILCLRCPFSEGKYASDASVCNYWQFQRKANKDECLLLAGCPASTWLEQAVSLPPPNWHDHCSQLPHVLSSPPMVQTQRKTEHNGSSDGVILFELVVQTNHLRRKWFQVLGSLLCPAGLSFSPEIDSSLLSYVSQSASERSFLFCGEKVRCPVLICTLLLFVCTLERCTVYWLWTVQALALVCTSELRTACFSFALWSPAWSAAPSSLWSRGARRSWRVGANLASSPHCRLFFKWCIGLWREKLSPWLSISSSNTVINPWSNFLSH